MELIALSEFDVFCVRNLSAWVFLSISQWSSKEAKEYKYDIVSPCHGLCLKVSGKSVSNPTLTSLRNP